MYVSITLNQSVIIALQQSKSIFSNGISVKVDLEKGTYKINYPVK